jgi:hypothetical protein
MRAHEVLRVKTHFGGVLLALALKGRDLGEMFGIAQFLATHCLLHDNTMHISKKSSVANASIVHGSILSLDMRLEH